MPATLRDAISSLKFLTKSVESSTNMSDELLGKYEGIIPGGKTSTEFIKDLRKTMFGKIEG